MSKRIRGRPSEVFVCTMSSREARCKFREESEDPAPIATIAEALKADSDHLGGTRTAAGRGAIGAIASKSHSDGV